MWLASEGFPPTVLFRNTVTTSERPRPSTLLAFLDNVDSVINPGRFVQSTQSVALAHTTCSNRSIHLPDGRRQGYINALNLGGHL